MDLRQMRYFVAVARERNFTRAAQMLHIAQPPLSRQIQLLEEELGVDLIIRKSRPIRLTDAGRLFYEQALQVLGRVDQMRAATRRVTSSSWYFATLPTGTVAFFRPFRGQLGTHSRKHHTFHQCLPLL